MTGANKSFLERELLHIATLMHPPLEEVVAQSEVVVIGNGNPAFREVQALLREDQILIDLAGITRSTLRHPELAAILQTANSYESVGP